MYPNILVTKHSACSQNDSPANTNNNKKKEKERMFAFFFSFLFQSSNKL